MKKYPGATKDELDDIGDLIHQERLEERMQEEEQAIKDARKEYVWFCKDCGNDNESITEVCSSCNCPKEV